MPSDFRTALGAADAELERAGMPDAVDARVRARLRAGRVHRRPSTRLGPMALALSGAAALLLGVGSTRYLKRSPPEAVVTSPAARSEVARQESEDSEGKYEAWGAPSPADVPGTLEPARARADAPKRRRVGIADSVWKDNANDAPGHYAGGEQPEMTPKRTRDPNSLHDLAGSDIVRARNKAQKSDSGLPDLGLDDRDGRPGSGGETTLGFLGTGRGGGGYVATLPTASGPPLRRYLDPEGRFATTYRPGGGSFARFAEALARGHAPPRALQLAADFGGRYGEPLAAPTETALSLRADTERAALPPAGGPVHLRLRLRGAEALPMGRPVIAATLILDVSGSMSGEPIRQAREAARQMVARLQPTDRVAIVTYETGARVVVPEGPVGARKQAILQAIDRIETAGSTNLEAGLAAGYAQARRAPDRADVVRLAVVFSDGEANVGNTDPWQLSARAARAFHDGIETTTIGIGSSYDGRQMVALSEHGGGGYYYVQDLASIAAILAQEIELRAQPVARAVELRVRVAPGVRLLQTYGSRRLGEAEAARVRGSEVAIDRRAERHDRIRADRQVDAHGGMRFFIPGFARADSHTMLLELEAPPGHGQQALATVELRYKDRVRGANHVEELVVRVDTAGSAEASAATESPSVARTVLGFRTGMTLLGASGSRHASWAARVAERAQLLRAAAARWHDPTLGRDAELLEQYASVLGSGELSRDPLVLSLLLDRAAYQLLH